MIAVITAIPASAVAWMSIWRKRSSRPSPRRPRIVSLRPPKRNTAPKAVMIASDCSPRLGLPPTQRAASNTSPSATENRGRNHFDLGIRISIEHRLHIRLEVPGEGEREREGGGVALLLDRVDRLPRDVERSGQLSLREPPCGTQFAHPVLHLVTSM